MSARDPLTSQCTATNKQTGERCKKWVRGGGPCRSHGGNAKQIKASREVRLVEMEAQLAAEKKAEPWKPKHPVLTLMNSVESAEEILEQLKSDLRRGELEPAMLTAYGRWVDRTGHLAKLAVDAGIDGARLELEQTRPSQEMADTLVVIMRSVLADPRLRAVQDPAVHAAVIQDAMAVAAGEQPARPPVSDPVDDEPIEGELLALPAGPDRGRS